GTERARFMGWQAAFMGLGGVVFLIGGGFLAELGWRWPFTIYLLSFLFIPLILISLPEPPQPDHTSDRGMNTEDGGNDSPFRLLGFIFMVALAGMTIFYFVPVQIPFYVEMLFDAGPTASGVAIAVSTLFGVITSLSYGRIRGHMGYIAVLGANFGLIGVGYVVISLAGSYAIVLAGLAICGLGMGLLFPNLNVWLASDVPVAMRGLAVGGLTTAVFLGQFLSPLISQPLVQAFGLEAMFLVAGGVLLALALIFVVFRQQISSFTRQ
ncbi:MAG: MFS transporter, partial [Balneolales bacterium]